MPRDYPAGVGVVQHTAAGPLRAPVPRDAAGPLRAPVPRDYPAGVGVVQHTAAGPLRSPVPRDAHGAGACTLTDMSSTPSTPRSRGAGGPQSPSTPRAQGAGGLQSPNTLDLRASCHNLFKSPRAVQAPSAALSRYITLDALHTAYRAQLQHVAEATAAGTLKVIAQRPQPRLGQHIMDGLAAAQKLLGQDNTAHHTRGGGIMEGPRPDTEGGKVCSRVCVDSTDACIQRRPCSRDHMPVRVLAVARASSPEDNTDSTSQVHCAQAEPSPGGSGHPVHGGDSGGS